MSLATKLSASMLIYYFSSHPATFGFWASTPPDNITLISANREADKSLSDFQTGVGAAAHATLDTEQLISHLQVTLVDTLSLLPNAEGGVIPVSEVHELLLKIYDNLDKAVSKQVGHLAHILAYLFNSVSMQHCEVLASQFPFLHSLRDVIPPSEACLNGCINWSLAQALSLFLLRGMARLGHRLGSISQYRRDLFQGLYQGLVGHPCLRDLTWRVGMRLIQVVRSLLVEVSPPVLLRLGEREAWGLAFLMCQSPQLLQPPQHLHLQFFRLVCFSNFLINEEALHPTGLCLISFGVTIFSLGPILPCSVTSGNLMSRQQQLIILLFRGMLLRFWLRMQLNPLLVALVSIP